MTALSTGTPIPDIAKTKASNMTDAKGNGSVSPSNLHEDNADEPTVPVSTEDAVTALRELSIVIKHSDGVDTWSRDAYSPLARARQRIKVAEILDEKAEAFILEMLAASSTNAGWRSSTPTR